MNSKICFYFFKYETNFFTSLNAGLVNSNFQMQALYATLICMRTKSQGILLQAIPYLGKGRIFKIFTEDAGLITLIAKKPSLALLSPFCIAEWLYQKKQSEIFTLTECSLTDSLDGLRQSYAAITAAGSMAQDLLRTQLPGKTSPALYKLLSCYLKKILIFDHPTILAASFRLKLLLHEGLLALQSSCSHCNEEACYLIQGESVCSSHASSQAIGFTVPEWEILHCLTFAKQFSQLQQIDYPLSLQQPLTALFEERTKNQ